MTRRLAVDQPFDLEAVLHGTQDFRWLPREDGWHSGVLAGNLVRVRQAGDALEYRAGADLDALLRRYFRLDEDVRAIRADISARDVWIAELADQYPHLRLLRQPDPWECAVAYICSARASIPGIARSVEAIAARLGEEMELDGEVRHAFPNPGMVLEAGLGSLEELNLGLNRHRKIFAAAERVCDGRLDLGYLARPQVCYAEAKRRLMGCYGVGEKIADCIALFALDKAEAFPVDTWVERAMARYFTDRQQPFGEDLVMWAQDRFGRHAGYANQLLFMHQIELGRRRGARP